MKKKTVHRKLDFEKNLKMISPKQRRNNLVIWASPTFAQLTMETIWLKKNFHIILLYTLMLEQQLPVNSKQIQCQDHNQHHNI